MSDAQSNYGHVWLYYTMGGSAVIDWQHHECWHVHARFVHGVVCSQSGIHGLSSGGTSFLASMTLRSAVCWGLVLCFLILLVSAVGA